MMTFLMGLTVVYVEVKAAPVAESTPPHAPPVHTDGGTTAVSPSSGGSYAGAR